MSLNVITFDPVTLEVFTHTPIGQDTMESLLMKVPNSFIYDGPLYEFNKWDHATSTVVEDLTAKFQTELEEWKLERDYLTDNIVITTSKGFVLDGDELAQTRMTRALIGLQPGQLMAWVDYNDQVQMLAAEDLGEALYLAGTEQGHIWTEGRPNPPQE